MSWQNVNITESEHQLLPLKVVGDSSDQVTSPQGTGTPGGRVACATPWAPQSLVFLLGPPGKVQLAPPRPPGRAGEEKC